MEFRLLRYFIAVAEELHIGRAAERLGIEPSPMSRAMRDLEARLDVKLLDRSARKIQLTSAGQMLLGEARRVLATLDHAIQATKGVGQGYQSFLRVGICDGLAQPRVATLLARSRALDPELGVRVFELPLSQQLKCLHNDLLDVGFGLSDAVNEGLTAEPVWSDPLSAILPARHPLLAYPQIKLEEAFKYPLVLCHPDAPSGCHNQLQAVIDSAAGTPKIADRVTSLGVMLTLVGAGYGVGFAIGSQVQTLQRPDIAIRPLADPTPRLTTYLLRRGGEPSEELRRFIARVRELDEPRDDGSGV